MGFLDFIFGTRKHQMKSYLENGAIILDVRTKREWDSGHIENALHIPIDELKNRLEEVKQLRKPIIACCASGVRSAKATKFLNLNNIEAINGGGWISVKKNIED